MDVLTKELQLELELLGLSVNKTPVFLFDKLTRYKYLVIDLIDLLRDLL